MEFGKKKVGKVGTSKFLNILLPHKYVGAVFQDHCLICNFIPKTWVPVPPHPGLAQAKA